jgi:hypothetical protein
MKANTRPSDQATGQVGVDNADVSTDDSEFRVVTHKKGPKRNHRNRDVVVGTSPPTEGSLAAAPRMLWLHISRLNKVVTADDVLNYVKTKLPNEKITCEKLTTQFENTSFKIGADFKLLKTLNQPDFWPSGVIVRRFFHARAKNVPGT